MRRVAIAHRHNGTLEVDAFETATPGLVINRALPGDAPPAEWTITHERSGLAVGYCNGCEWAQALAARLGGLVDWTQSGDEVLTHLDKMKARALVAEYGNLTVGDPYELTAEARRR